MLVVGLLVLTGSSSLLAIRLHDPHRCRSASSTQKSLLLQAIRAHGQADVAAEVRLRHAEQVEGDTPFFSYLTADLLDGNVTRGRAVWQVVNPSQLPPAARQHASLFVTNADVTASKLTPGLLVATPSRNSALLTRAESCRG